MAAEGGAARSGCRGCGQAAGPGKEEIKEIVRAYFQWCPHSLADEGTRDRRLSICGACPDLLFGSTCRHSGCLVEVRARLADRSCPAPGPRW